MTFTERLLAAFALLMGRASVTLDWGDVKAQGISIGDDAALVLLTHEEAARLGVKQ